MREAQVPPQLRWRGNRSGGCDGSRPEERASRKRRIDSSASSVITLVCGPLDSLSSLGEPRRIVFNHLHHLDGLALDRNHPWQRGPAVLAGASERLGVSDHLLLTEPAYDRGWQYPFNKHVLLKNHL